MSVYVDQSAGVDTTSGTTDLFTISWNDGNLGQGADMTVAGTLEGISSIPVAPVTYTPGVTTGKATADRLYLLVNNNSSNGLNWDNPIVITPLFGGMDPYSGMSIDGNGSTYVDTAATPNVIHVVYDTSQNGGQGIAAFDTSGNPIQTPNAVILYHELSHAYHYAINQIPFPQGACPGNTTDEPAAELDENVMRTELGLCQRDPCNHSTETTWGQACGGSAYPGGPPLHDGGGSSGGGSTGGCFIVTAATGSSHAYEIRRLRAVRDRIAACSGISRALIDAIYTEYFEFSPAVARSIERDPTARATVRLFIVRPLFAWYLLAERLALDDGDANAIDRASHAVIAACEPERATVIIPLLEHLSRGEALPTHAPGRLWDFADAIVRANQQPLAGWALMSALSGAWTCGAGQSDPIDGVAGWLSAAPFERLGPPSALDAELQQLARFFDFAPQARLSLGGRLSVAWPGAAAALERHGFILRPCHRSET